MDKTLHNIEYKPFKEFHLRVGKSASQSGNSGYRALPAKKAEATESFFKSLKQSKII